ncbi:hypothetical protein ASE86_06315 [Sphingomonas sp. Leaf33]|uniref:TnsD family Tn7-like transposition protein n=1 Tax=Sphingomonas sp. Leaf33 TaxID=1736215 RepID=UPI0006FD1644|nr:TnsD family Tn7-like transposition protein [Sphingomonas sp. Leaf33]KQN25813.1 hypothetical protein ASE86_06315 [Sphingomonas sp. Leaf33]
MLCHLPDRREQELLYSVVARCGRYLQAPEAGPFMRELLGRRWAIAGVGLPGHLATLVRDQPDHARDAAVDRLIDDATLFSFHTAFMPIEVRSQVREAMRGDVSGIYTKLGLAAFKVRPPQRLRFCPDCLDAMEADFGDAWWRRDHQLPGVPVCSVHGTVLRISDVDPGDGNRHSFVAASRVVCRGDADLAIGSASDADLSRLLELATLASALLDAPPAALDHADRAKAFRARLTEAGLMRSARKVDHPALFDAFMARWGGVPDLIPGLELGEDRERSWLAAMVRTGRRAAHPHQHLMLSAMLDGQGSRRADRPFGTGPWPCRNPAADHHGCEVIRDVVVRSDRGTLYGDFACACGYLYTIARRPDGTVGEPRFRRFGPLLAPALCGALKRGGTLRGTARALGLDPKTLMREAAMAGVVVPWNAMPSGVVPAQKNVAAVTVKARRVRGRARAKRNWFSIDTRLARSARQAAHVVAAEMPPVRVTFAEMERRISKRDWVAKRRAKLPQTVEVLRGAVEGTDAFRRRRLDWQVAEAVRTGDLRACEVLRAAGLPMGWLPAVRDAISSLRDRGRVAA